MCACSFQTSASSKLQSPAPVDPYADEIERSNPRTGVCGKVGACLPPPPPLPTCLGPLTVPLHPPYAPQADPREPTPLCGCLGGVERRSVAAGHHPALACRRCGEHLRLPPVLSQKLLPGLFFFIPQAYSPHRVGTRLYDPGHSTDSDILDEILQRIMR